MGECMSAPMNKFMEALDVLGTAKCCAQCVWHAAGDFPDGEPLRAVANIVSDKIEEAIELLEEYKKEERQPDEIAL